MDVRRHPHHGVTFAILAIAGMSYALLQSLVLPALRTIQEDLGTTTTAAAWILTAYLLSASIATPIAGRLGDMFGKKRMFVVVLAILAVGTFISAIATTIGVMIVGRVIQGASGAIFPLAFGIIRDEFPAERRAGGIALISAILGAGGGLGIVLSGPITEHLSYHWLFWIPLVAIVVAAIAAWIVIPESPVRTPGHVNALAAMLLSAWLVALLLGISEGSSWGWTSSRVLGLFVLGAVLLFAWIRVESRSRQPLVDMRMMRIRGVWTTNLAALLIGFGMYSSFILIPQFVRDAVGQRLRVLRVGDPGRPLPLPSTIAMILVSPLAGRLAGIVGSRVPLIAGSIVTAVVVPRPRLRTRAPLAALPGDVAPRRRDRARLRGDGEPDRRRGPARADGRRDGHEHDHADDRRRARRRDRGQHPRGEPTRERPPERPRLHARVRGFGGLRCSSPPAQSFLVPRPKLETLEALEHAPGLVFEAPESRP